MKYPPEIREKAFRLYCQKIQIREIARQIGVPWQAVGEWSYKGKWKTRRLLQSKGGRRMQEKLEAQIDESEKQANNDTEKQDTAFLCNLESLPFEEKQGHFRQNMAIQALRIPQIMADMTRAELLKHADKIEKLEKIARRALHLEEPAPVPIINIGLLSSGPLPPLEIDQLQTTVSPDTGESIRAYGPQTPQIEAGNNTANDSEGIKPEEGEPS